MKHETKTFIFKSLALLPKWLGDAIYHKIQARFGRESFETKWRSNQNTLQQLDEFTQRNGVELQQAKVVEIGSGWVPILPYLLRLERGVKQVDTYDVNAHFSLEEIQLLNDRFQQHPLFELASESDYPIIKGIHYFPSTNVLDGNIEAADLVVSRFVLEHVPPKEMEELHRVLAQKLKPGSHIVHFISPSDHRAYTDTRIGLQDFLQYSQEEWDKIQTRFDYHNRMRLPHYLALFERYFDVLDCVYESAQPGTPNYLKYEQLNVHADFSGFSLEENTAGAITVLLRTKAKKE